MRWHQAHSREGIHSWSHIVPVPRENDFLFSGKSAQCHGTLSSSQWDHSSEKTQPLWILSKTVYEPPSNPLPLGLLSGMLINKIKTKMISQNFQYIIKMAIAKSNNNKNQKVWNTGPLLGWAKVIFITIPRVPWCFQPRAGWSLLIPSGMDGFPASWPGSLCAHSYQFRIIKGVSKIRRCLWAWWCDQS